MYAYEVALSPDSPPASVAVVILNLQGSKVIWLNSAAYSGEYAALMMNLLNGIW